MSCVEYFKVHMPFNSASEGLSDRDLHQTTAVYASAGEETKLTAISGMRVDQRPPLPWKSISTATREIPGEVLG